MTKKVRVRFAPSPTGYLHIGGARTALFNWFFARQHGGEFILRIEDTDTSRLKEDSVSQILRSMKWLGIDWDEGPEVGGSYGPYTQSERQNLYKEAAQKLLSEGKAYHDGDAILLRLPNEGKIIVTDIIRGHVEFDVALLDDLVLMKSDGFPAYNFACVVDDHAMELTHIIRADEHLANTPKQLLIYEALGYEAPQFAHISMILAPDRSKLSKRHGATSVEEFRDQGFLAPAIVNYLTLLGWSPDGEDEIITVADAVQQFNLEKVAKKAAIYDTKKLAWMNGQYMINLPLEEIFTQVLPLWKNRGMVPKDVTTDNRLLTITDMLRSRTKTLVELVDMSTYFFNTPTTYDEKGVQKHFTKPGTADLLRECAQHIRTLTAFTEVTCENAYNEIAAKHNLSVGKVIHPSRLALTGSTNSPGMYETMVAIGKEECIGRLLQAANYIDACMND